MERTRTMTDMTRTPKNERYKIPNVTIPNWLRTNTPNFYVDFRETITAQPEYDNTKDIFHQPLALVLKSIQICLSYYNIIFTDTWLTPGLRKTITEIENEYGED